MNQEKREQNKNKSFVPGKSLDTDIKHNEFFLNQNENIFLERCKFKYIYLNQVVNRLRIGGPSLSSKLLQLMKAEDIGELGLFQTNLSHV